MLIQQSRRHRSLLKLLSAAQLHLLDHQGCLRIPHVAADGESGKSMGTGALTDRHSIKPLSADPPRPVVEVPGD